MKVTRQLGIGVLKEFITRLLIQRFDAFHAIFFICNKCFIGF